MKKAPAVKPLAFDRANFAKTATDIEKDMARAIEQNDPWWALATAIDALDFARDVLHDVDPQDEKIDLHLDAALSRISSAQDRINAERTEVELSALAK